MTIMNNGNDSYLKRKSTNKSMAMRVIILAVFFLVASVAIYFMVSPAQKQSNDHNAVDRLAEEPVLSTGNQENQPQITAGKLRCLREDYLDQVKLIDMIRYNFTIKKDLMALLSKLSLLAHDDKLIRSNIKDLIYLFKDKKSNCDIHILYDEYKVLRSEISKQMLIKKYNHSIFLKFLLKLVNVEIKASSYAEASFGHEILQQAEQSMMQGRVDEAYSLVDSLDQEYKIIAKDWLSNALDYIQASNAINSLVAYGNSDEYRRNFIMECK